jgi:hypothetical protein
MRKVPLSRSLLFFLEELDYSEAGLSADPDATPLASAFQDAIAEWDTLFKTERLARRNIVRADALVAVRNERLDAGTMQFGALARASAPDVLNRCFTTAPSQFVRRNLRKQCEMIQTVIVPEIAKLAADHSLKPFGTRLHTLADAAVTALDDRAQALGNRQSSANDVLEWKEGINALRLTTYAELLKITATQGLPKSWAESFFRPSDDASDTETDSEALPNPPNP